jgi:hypothetical protein
LPHPAEREFLHHPYIFLRFRASVPDRQERQVTRGRTAIAEDRESQIANFYPRSRTLGLL